MTRLATPSSTSPPISPSCAAAPIPRSWWRQHSALGLEAIAVTDHNSLAGVVRAHLAAKEVGIKFIVGARLDLKDAPSLLVYPTDRAAYGRLCRLLTLGQRRAEKGQCTLYLEDVAAHAEGLICIALPPTILPGLAEPRQGDASSCLDPPSGDGDAADFAAADQGRARPAAPLYLAARHAYRGDDRARIAALAEIGRARGTPLVATNAVLYHAPHRRPLQDVLTCIREKCTIHDGGLSSRSQCRAASEAAERNGAALRRPRRRLARSVEIADACRFSLDELKYEYPDEPVPHGKTPQSHLEDLTWEGAAWRFPGGMPDQRARDAR